MRGSVRALAAYPAKLCPIRTHWDSHDQYQLPSELTPQQERLVKTGRRFESVIFDEILVLVSGAVDLRETGSRSATDQARRTLEAMSSGVPVIIEGSLGQVNGRSGRPDLLVRVDDDGAPLGYVPVDVKAHGHLGRSVTTRSAGAPVSELAEPFPVHARPHKTVQQRAAGDRFDDVLQLAHYTHMLQDLGHHPGDAWLIGGVIGTSLPEESRVVAWHRLDEPVHKSFSRENDTGYRSRTALDRYDHEFGFRQKIAQRIDDTVEPNESVRALAEDLDIEPYRIPECATCPYEVRCSAFWSDHASAQIVQGPLGVRTWRSLAKHQVRTVSDLARLDVDAFRKQGHAQGWNLDYNDTDEKLRAAQRRAQLIADNRAWEWVKDEFTIPRAQVEIDVDFEYDTATGACYLITVRKEVNDSEQVTYKSWTNFDATTRETGNELIHDYLDWIVNELDAATAATGQDGDSPRPVVIYHWAGPEEWMVRQALPDGAQDLRFHRYESHLVDLSKLFARALFSVKGTSVKVIGPAYGFKWRMVDAGGATSLVRFDEARSHDLAKRNEARAWLEEYNKDDVNVMAHIRRQVTANPDFVPAYKAVAGVSLAEE